MESLPLSRMISRTSELREPVAVAEAVIVQPPLNYLWVEYCDPNWARQAMATLVDLVSDDSVDYICTEVPSFRRFNNIPVDATGPLPADLVRNPEFDAIVTYLKEAPVIHSTQVIAHYLCSLMRQHVPDESRRTVSSALQSFRATRRLGVLRDAFYQVGSYYHDTCFVQGDELFDAVGKLNLGRFGLLSSADAENCAVLTIGQALWYLLCCYLVRTKSEDTFAIVHGTLMRPCSQTVTSDPDRMVISDDTEIGSTRFPIHTITHRSRRMPERGRLILSRMKFNLQRSFVIMANIRIIPELGSPSQRPSELTWLYTAYIQGLEEGWARSWLFQLTDAHVFALDHYLRHEIQVRALSDPEEVRQFWGKFDSLEDFRGFSEGHTKRIVRK